MRTLHRVVVVALPVLLVACVGSSPTGGAGQAGATATPGTTAVAVGPAVTPDQAGGGGNRGFDCATLVTPAELDQISGFTGATVSTTSRGDQNPDAPGYGECSYEEPAASIWSGTIAVATGDAVEGFDVQYDFNKEHGATAEAGLGTEAILNQTDAGTEIFAKSADGVGITVTLGWDTTETTKDKALDAIRQIVKTVLGRV